MELLITAIIVFGLIMIASVVFSIIYTPVWLFSFFISFTFFMITIMITIMNTVTNSSNSNYLIYNDIELRHEYEITKQIPLEQRIYLPIMDQVKIFNASLKNAKEDNKTSIFKDAIDDRIDSIKPIEL